MSFSRNSARALMLSTAIFMALSPAVAAPAFAAIEAEIKEGPKAGLPDDVSEGFRTFVDILEISGADENQINAARAFMEFVETNPELVTREVPSMSKLEQEEMLSGFEKGSQALRALEAVTDVLVSQDWLKEVNPELAKQIQTECKRRFLGGRDMYAATDLILQDPSKFDDDPVNLLEDVGGIGRECIENLQVYSRVAAEEIKKLDTYIEAKKVELQEAKDRGDDQAVARIEAEIADAEKRREEVKKGLDLAALLEVLAGLASMAVGVAAIIATGGSCVPCYGEVVGGALAVTNGIKKLEGKEVTDVPIPVRRPGVNPEGQPTAEEYAAEGTRLEADPNYTVIQPEKPGGNFHIATDKNTGDIVIFQVTPPLQITLEIAGATNGLLSQKDLLDVGDLDKVSWTQVGDPLLVNPASVSVVLKGDLDGVPVQVSFDQNPVNKPVVVTVEPN
ncbi:hypothetical protein [Phaeobacter inhibens]|uniref:hypothetical protein n=1 Tax=Phaeobacter inhibens TaxID=221822 RepID=UPI0021A6F599|nr:hypothetical protein [Phaeobacter inhibens]UWS07076.1 hypothetical protein K4K98_12610 [Phaeobacter inhibens]